MRKRTIFDYIIITLKGIAMGAADVVPGVSGGTIALISGIYDELIKSINAFDLSLISTFKQEGIKAVWKKVNANFLIALVLGIIISVLSLAKVLSWLLENKPILLWSFFFGLVLASIWFVSKQIKKWNIVIFSALLIGALFAYFITQLQPITDANPSVLYLILAGAIAICAMILPGISGAFILVLLGVYEVVLRAIHQREIDIVIMIGIGAIIGLLSFARLLKFILTRYRNITMAVLTGFIIGALSKIWPWKKVLSTISLGNKEWVLKEENVLPFNYPGESYFIYAVGLMVLGFLLIIILENWGKKQT